MFNFWSTVSRPKSFILVLASLAMFEQHCFAKDGQAKEGIEVKMLWHPAGSGETENVFGQIADAAWETTSLPLSIKPKKDGFDLWYRLKFDESVLGSNQTSPHIYLPRRVQTRLDVYQYGLKIYEWGSTTKQVALTFHAFPVRDLKAPVYIHMRSALPRVGMAGTPEVTAFRPLIERLIWGDSDRIFSAIALFCLAVGSFVFFVKRREDKTYLYLGLYCLSIGFYIFAITDVTVLVHDGSFWVDVGMPALFFSPVWFGFFVLPLVGGRTAKAIKLVSSLHAGLAIASIAALPILPYGLRTVFPVFQLLLFGFMVTVLNAVIRGMRKDPYLRVLAWGLLILFATIVNDILFDSDLILSTRMISWGFLAFAGSLATIQGLKLVHLHQQVQAQSVELERKNKELEKLDEMKDEFLANTSHELRTPLHGILGLADGLSLRLGSTADEESRTDLDLIKSSAKRLGFLVDQLLDFSKAKKKELSLNLSTVNLSLVVKTVIASLRPLWKGKNIMVQSKIADEIYVKADENRILQVVYNLIGNAIKFTENGSVEVSGSLQDSLVKLSVKDTGIGIREEDVDEIFKAFQQGDGSATRSQGVTGLGLTISKDMLEAMDGEIEVESTFGEGSTFSFTLPKAQKPMDGKQEQTLMVDAVQMLQRNYEKEITDKINDASSSSTPEAEKRELVRQIQVVQEHSEVLEPKNFLILVVDDEPVNQRVISNYLGGLGYQVHAVSSGKQALEYIESNLPSLVLLDVMMPNMDGYEVCHELREHHTVDNLPILFLTAKNRPQDLDKAFELGGNDFITKPFSNMELVHRLKVHANVSALTRELRKALETIKRTTIFETELQAAKLMQESFVPDNFSHSYFELAHRYAPAGHAGGDLIFYKYDPIHEKVVIFVGDVTGHDLGSALLNAVCLGALNACFSDLSVPLNETCHDQVHRIATSVNQAIRDIADVATKLMTAFIASIDLKTGKGSAINAGHPRPSLIRDNIPTRLKVVSNPPLGCSQDPFKSSDIEISHEDYLFVYTDGLAENSVTTTRIFRRNDLMKICDFEGSAEDLAKNIETNIMKLWGSYDAADDDYCFLLLRRHRPTEEEIKSA